MIIKMNGKQQIFNVKVQNKTVKTTALSVKKKNIILQKKGKMKNQKFCLNVRKIESSDV